MNNEIHICFTLDSNYINYALIAIYSILKERILSTPIHFYILGDKIKDFSVFKRFTKFKNVDVYTSNIDLDKYISYDLQFRHCTKAVELDLLIPELPIFKNLDRLLYLDPDIIVKKDLSSLYFHDITDKPLGCVKDYGLACVFNNKPVDLDLYKEVNTGVMIMDIKKLQKMNFTKICLDYLEKNRLIDQDIINRLFSSNDIFFLDPIYNHSWHKQFIVKGNYCNIDLYNKLYKTNYKSIDELNEKSVILHFHGDKEKMLKNNKVIKQMFDDYLTECKKIIG